MVVSSPRDLGLLHDEWRPSQWEAIQNSINSTKWAVCHKAPVGCGKSYMLAGEHRLSSKRTLILTGTRHLQTQYGRELRNLYPTDIRGKKNYSCRATEQGGEYYSSGSQPKSVAEGPCQFGLDCSLKQYGCIYYDRLREARYKKLVIANYAAWISANLFGDGWGDFDLIMCDEAHEAEAWLSRTLSIKLLYGLDLVIQAGFPDTDDPCVWMEWAKQHYPRVSYELKKTAALTRSNPRSMLKVRGRVSALEQAERALGRIRTIDDDWLVTRDTDKVDFQPIWVRKYAKRYLFPGAGKVVLASATIVQYELGLLGLSKDEYDYFEYPSTFPVFRRPIYYLPTVPMRYGMAEEETLEWIRVTDDFISRRLDRKGVIHTGSFARQEQLLRYSRFASLMVANSTSNTAIATLQKFRAMPYPAILVTPSMATGVDLPYKQAEYAIIPKMQFGNPYDPLLIARSREDPDHGYFQTAKVLRQAVGRHVRAEDDQGETLITDMNFEVFMKRRRHMLSTDFWEAVQIVDTLPEPLEAL